MKRKFAIIGGALLAAYVCIYIGLSTYGVYVPFTYGSNGIKDWVWAPSGFTDASGHLQMKSALFTGFWPLFWIDHSFWHDDYTGSNGPRYLPVPLNGGR